MMKPGISILLIFAVSLIIFSCNPDNTVAVEEREQTLFTLLNASETGINFINSVENQKDLNIFKYRNFYNG
ncbi:MAG: hypothetical protein HKO94_05465, partial [Flavobacteriaceae bacterium]|nr:hypothetical protein [Flavobacteriaceae bacterium]